MTTNDDWLEDDAVDGDIDFDKESGSSLREKLVVALAKVKELEEQNETKDRAITSREMDEAFAANGLKRNEGLGKALALAYDGPADAEALAVHLEAEYGYTWTGEPHPMADLITLSQAQLDQISSTAGSVPAESPWNEELARAEAVRDTDKTMAMKGQQVAGWFRP